MRRRHRLRPICAFALVAAGCFGGRLPPRELYRLTPMEPAPRVEQPAPLVSGSVAIQPYMTPGLYGRPSVVYRLNDTEYGAYASREWAIPLSTMLGLLTQDVLGVRALTRGRVMFDPPS